MKQVINPTDKDLLAEWLKKWTIEAITKWSPAFKELLEDETFIIILTKWYALHMRVEYQRERSILALIEGKEDILGSIDEYNEKRASGYSEVIYDIMQSKVKGE